MSLRNTALWCLILTAILCIGVALFPGWSTSVDEANGDRVSEWRLGLPSSPFFKYIRRDSPTGGFNIRSGVHLVSWSMLLLLAGCGCVEILRRVGPDDESGVHDSVCEFGSRQQSG